MNKLLEDSDGCQYMRVVKMVSDGPDDDLTVRVKTTWGDGFYLTASEALELSYVLRQAASQ